MNLKTHSVVMVMCTLDRYDSPFENGATVKDLGDALNGTCLAASDIRRAVGWLYGRGMLKVTAVRNGEPAWAVTSPEERVKL